MGDSPLNNLRKDLEKDSDAKDAAEISEIISSEAFRLSRDGIIQHHFALNYASQQQKPANNQRASSPSRFSTPPRSTRLGGKPNQQTSPKSNPHSSMLSSYSAANPEEAARYYKECAARPKGYRDWLFHPPCLPTMCHPLPLCRQRRRILHHLLTSDQVQNSLVQSLGTYVTPTHLTKGKSLAFLRLRSLRSKRLPVQGTRTRGRIAMERMMAGRKICLIMWNITT